MSKEARSEGSDLPEGGGDRMRGVGIPGRKNSHSRHFAHVGKSMCRVNLCRTRTANTNEILCCNCEGKGGGGDSGGDSEICLQGSKEVSTLLQKTGAEREP